jgi:hypothetical protein
VPEMHSVHFFVLVTAFLAVLGAARPSPKVAPRSFKVPRRASQHSRKNGAQAMAAAARKFGWGFIGNKNPKGSNNTNGGDDGEVTATPEDNAALFLAPVDIGGQQLNLDFDTGSSDLYVPLSSFAFFCKNFW